MTPSYERKEIHFFPQVILLLPARHLLKHIDNQNKTLNCYLQGFVRKKYSHLWCLYYECVLHTTCRDLHGVTHTDARMAHYLVLSSFCLQTAHFRAKPYLSQLHPMRNCDDPLERRLCGKQKLSRLFSTNSSTLLASAVPGSGRTCPGCVPFIP